jgi:GMP synthase PP-ATPase subunit
VTRRTFLKLKGVTDPEKKRKIIGNEFIKCSKKKPAASRRLKAR